ncbi:MAG: protein kinase [Chromatiales bacterium]|nr:protein kinase [Chromatiales bacterium]
MKLSIRHGLASSAGIKEHNEDACGFLLPDDQLLATKGAVAVIADGMSAAENGGAASKACVQGFLSDYFSTPESWSVKNSAQKVLAALNRWLYGSGQREYGTNKGMVTTFCAVVFKSNTAYLFHVGDSRIYRLRGEDFEPLTRDHRVQVSDEKSYLTRAMGIELNVDIDYRTVSLKEGDRFVLLTDGVHEFLSDAEIKHHLLTGGESLDSISQKIIDGALANNSNDNLCCLITDVVQVPNKDEVEFYRSLTQLPFPPSLGADMIIDGYRIVREIFSNKRTEIFLVEDEVTGEQMVLKAPSVNYSDDPNYINQFLHEEWAGRRIHNPHVMKVIEQKRPRQFLYYLTEYIEGRQLRQWLNDNPTPSLLQVRDIIGQIAKGLRAFHRLEMIHQDLKPENILIDSDGTVKIIDLGSTKIAGIEEIATPLDSNPLLGTVNYTAPEYLRGELASNRSDIFSLGVIAYEMLTGALPYGKTLTPRNLKHLRYISARDYNPEIPIWLDQTLEKAVRLDPLRRYEILSELTHDLSQPNPAFLRQERLPILERNPIGFWRGLAILLLLLNLWLITLLV